MVQHLRYAQLAWFSKPKGNRLAYRSIRRLRAGRILELGMGLGERAVRMIRLAAADHPQRRIEYSAIDLFEMRTSEDGAGLSLKLAHRKLAETSAKVRLIPGDPYSALARMANSLGPQDLVIISADQPGEALARAWFYVPRVLAPAAIVLIEGASARPGELELRLMPRAEIEQLARAATPRRAA